MSRWGYVTWTFAWWLLLATSPQTTDSFAELRSEDFPTLISAFLTLACIGLSVWIVVVGSVAALAPGSRALGRITPRFLRAAAAASAISATALVPAAAHYETLDGLPGLDRPQSSATSQKKTKTPGIHVVRPRDTLWHIAAQGPAATDAAIARSVRQWHQRNQTVIGDDPNLIFPGQKLYTPRKDLPT